MPSSPPRTPTAVRHCEGLVEVEVAYIGTDISGVGKADLGIHICTIHVYLTTCIVYGIYNLAYAALEYAVSRRIGYHQSAQLR